MRRANAKLQSDRRAEILDAAEACFARSGFHQASMQEICAEAGMSPGNLYRYFPSKEALIIGISERNRADAMESFAAAESDPNFFRGLENLARHHLVERTAQEVGLCAEIMAETRRNPEIARVYQAIETELRARLVALLKSASERGEILSDLDFDSAVSALMVLADGMSWRRAVDPNFDPEVVLPLILHMVHCVLTEPPRAQAALPEKSS